MKSPPTSTTLLRDAGADAASPRWNELVSRYRPALESFLAARFPSLAGEADDLVQETFAALARRLPGYVRAPDAKGHFRNYLLGILRRLAVQSLRRRGREAGALADAAALAPTASGNPADETEEREWRNAACEVALEQILADPATEERTKQVFLRVAIGGEKPADVAADYGLTRNAVDQIRHRVATRLRALAEALAGSGLPPGAERRGGG